MFRNIGFGAAAVLAIGALAIGCSDDSDSIKGGSDLRPGNFPGSQVDDSNFAADGRGFTEAGEYFVDGMHVFWNRANGSAIVMYETEDDDSGQNNLHASYFDGRALHAPVVLAGAGNGARQDENDEVDGVKVLWLNTAGNPDADIRNKNGDAFILFVREDLVLAVGSGISSDEDSNERLWLTHFDVSAANAPALGTVVGGFDTAAVALDTDIVSTGSDTDISTFGFVSDSLHNTHKFTDETDEVLSGDPTTYAYAFYGKDITSGATATPRFRFVALDLVSTGLQVAGGNDLNVGASAYASGEGADISGDVVVHNNSMIWHSSNVGTEDDDVTTVTVFSAAGTGVAATLNLGEDLVGTSADDTDMPRADDVYGPDHGLDAFYAFTTANGYQGAGTNGLRSSNTDLIASTWPNVATPAREAQEIDQFSGLIDTTNVDADLIIRAGTNGNVVSIDTVISRSGEFIAVLWTQQNSDLTDLDDSTNTIDGPSLHNLLFSRAVQTRKTRPNTAASTRTLALSLTTVLLSPAVNTLVNVNVSDPSSAIQEFDFQDGLANGGDDRGCSFQGNHLRVNWEYQQYGDQTATVSSDTRRLLVNGMTVVLDQNVATAPTATLVSTAEVIVDQADDGFLPGNRYSSFAVDAGDDSTTGNNPVMATATAGRVLVFFVSQESTSGKADDDTGTGFFTENRLFCWDAGTVVTVSTNPVAADRDLFQVDELLDGGTVPVNEDADRNPTYVGSTVHVFWTEDSSQNGFRYDLGTRSYDLRATTAASPVPLDERFTPETSVEPNFINNPNGTLLLYGSNYAQSGPNTTNALDGDNTDYEEFKVVRNRSTIGVFFDEGNRIFYQQTAGDADGYYSSNGQFRPELVDNESNVIVMDYQIESPPVCNDLSDTMVFFMKEDLDDVTDQESRIQVRIAR